jgi:hypothetical protein
VQFQTRTQQPSALEPANASSIGMTFITLLFPQRPIPALAFTLNLALAEEILVNHPVETSSPQHASSPRAEPSSVQVEILSSSGTQSPPSQTEVPASPEMNPSTQPEASSPSRVQSPLGQAEIPILTEVNPPSPQPEALNLPGNAPVSCQVEASALPRAPQTPTPPIAQEIPPASEQNPAPVQGIQHEVSTHAQFCYPLLFNELLPTRQSYFFRIKIHHHQAHHW